MGVRNPRTGVPVIIQAQARLNSHMWETLLAEHPDRNFVQKIIDYTDNGVPIAYTGPRKYRTPDNWKSAYKYRDIVYETLLADVKKGTKAGPFSFPPFETFVGSPLGAFQRKHSLKYRVIHDLSWPPHQSVNEYISDDDATVHYVAFDDIAKKVNDYGRGALLSRLDLAAAYKHVVVRPDDWDLLGCTWTHDSGYTEFFVDLTLPFGLKSSAKLFTEMADALKLAMEYSGVSEVDHYLDDYIMIGPRDSDICDRNLNIMINTCRKLGFEVNFDKVTKPNPVVEFLGLIIDSNKLEIRVSQERLQETLTELNKFKHIKSCTKRELLSIIGKLVFISRAVHPGRSFIRRMIESSKKARYLHHKIRLNSACRDDISWWINFLPQWNGVSLIRDTDWITSADIHLYTDASNIAVAGYFQGYLFVLPFKGQYAYLKRHSINFRELFAIVVALGTWGRYMERTKVLFHCDNLAIVHAIQNRSSKDINLMHLIRSMFFYMCQA